MERQQHADEACQCQGDQRADEVCRHGERNDDDGKYGAGKPLPCADRERPPPVDS